MSLHPDFLRLPIAHRGLHSAGVPENSLAAFTAAIEAGYGIELDIQPAADGTPMVFHDYDLLRMSDDEGYITDMDLDDLAEIRLADTEETIPTLADTLRLVAGRVPLLIEIKDQDGRLGTSIGEVHNQVASLLEAYEGPVAVMSFNPNTVEAFGKAAPDIARGLTTAAFSKDDWPMLDDETREKLSRIEDFGRAGVSFISHHQVDLANEAVTDLKSKGVPVLTWTVRSAAEEAEARKVADGITFEDYRP
ncbi:glycerophosphodiester phosphodiesterase family protein [Paracoccus aerodenitrificans]|uniref:glycerophosphodiester phosphodiesterase family protein n=1 Tax=Paracoccus aerodenitrificans TaxID=3017781 RepID=UPI0022F08BA1|nr:glycerophosphodiester phosphodiesterase family protein [Paracoccus aerodenitrificans]WBU62996.1 glycerophosphodiester phosphodiesterase family protein [Paracoccus aerodenitrificans]